MKLSLRLITLFLVLVTIFQPFVAVPLANAAASEPSPDEEAGDKGILIEWSATSTQERYSPEPVYTESSQSKDSIEGWAYLTYKVNAATLRPMDVRLRSFQLVARHDALVVRTATCEKYVTTSTFVDPARYTNDASIFADTWHIGNEGDNMLFTPRKDDKGRWILYDPFVHLLPHTLPFTLQRQSSWSSCHGSGETTTTVSRAIEVPLDQFGYYLVGDEEGKVFQKNEDVMVYDRHVQYNVVVKFLDTECVSSAAPLNADDSAIKNLDIALEADNVVIPPNQPRSLKPPKAVTLTVRVTCDGVPVNNAGVHVEVSVKGGGHLHNNATHARPRGYLNGQKLTEEKKGLLVQTDTKGIAKITFLPGRDTLTDGRGIAGTYVVTARLADPRFAKRQAQRAIQVKRTDFVALPAASNYVILRGGARRHPEGTWGLQSTHDAIAMLANDFQKAQEAHNEALLAANKKPWRVVPLSINDISLQDGGLYDVTGFSVVTQKVTGQDWQPPHYSHRDGTGIDMNSFRGNPNRPWLVATVRRLGERYGKWEKREPSLHLEVKPDAQSAYIAANAPDVGVSLFPNRALEFDIAAPGQVVSYTIAFDNMNGGQESGALRLSSQLPQGLTFVSANPQPSGFSDSQMPFWDAGTLAAGAFPELIEVGVSLNAEVAVGSVLTVTATATTSGVDANPANDQDNFEIFVQPPGPDLVVASNLDAVAMTVERPVTVSLTVANLGTLVAPDTILRLTMPPHVTWSHALPAPMTTADGELGWSLGDLALDAEQGITVTLDLDPALLMARSSEADEAQDSHLTFSLAASSAVADIAPENNQSQVVVPVTAAGSDIAVWLANPAAETPGVLQPGQVVTYTVSYGNYGNQEASSTAITMSLGSGFTFLSAEAAPNQTIAAASPSGSVWSWNVGHLPVGSTGIIQVQLRVEEDVPDRGAILVTAQTPTWDVNTIDNSIVAYSARLQPVTDSDANNIFIPLVKR